MLKVKLNRKRLIVLLEEQIYIYDISNMQLLHTIETSSNPGAICALSPSSENCYLAYPSPAPQSTSPFAFPSHVPSATATNNSTSPNRTGDVVVFDTLSLLPVNVIEAHKSPLSAVSFNADGTLLATASDKGTIVRVFSIPSATKINQFRRGTYPAKIFSMNFNLSSSLLAVSSATETVHIFRLGRPGQMYQQPVKSRPARAPLSTPPEEDQEEDSSSSGSILPHLVNSGESNSGMDAFIEAKRRNGTMASIIRRSSLNLGRQVAGAMGTYLPSAVTEIWEPQRDFAFVKLPAVPGIKSVVSFNSTSTHVLVVTSEGYFYQYAIDLERGGECELIQQYSLIDTSDDMP